MSDLKKKPASSISRALNTFYLLFLGAIIIFSLIFSSITTNNEVTEAAFINAENTLKDKHSALNRTFNQLFEQVVNLNDNPNLINVINDEGDALNQAVDMNNSIKELYYRFQDVLSSIYINVSDGEFFFNGGEVSQRLNDIDYHQFFDLAEDTNGYIWLDADASPFTSEDAPAISLCKVIGDDTSEVSGVIVFNIKYDYVAGLLQEGSVTENGQLVLVSDSDAVYPADNTLPKTVAGQKKLERQTVDAEGEKYNTQGLDFALNNWRLLVAFPEKDLQRAQSSYLILAVILFAFLFVIGTVMIVVVDRFISRPIQTFAKKVEKTSITAHSGSLDAEHTRFKELEVLYTSFNSMIHKNEQLLTANEQAMEESSRLEIELLQSQINPHFLYNTLYSIQSLSDMGMNQDASMMTRALADFYRIGLSEGNLLVTLDDELEHTKNYLTIMNYRYGDRFDYEIHVEEDALITARIPKVSLQPIVENSIYHGLKELEEMGDLQIIVKRSGENVLITVQDNGKGISEGKLAAINEEINLSSESDRKVTGVGLRSVNLRIKKYFGPAYGLWVESPAVGALVKIVIPQSLEPAEEVGDS